MTDDRFLLSDFIGRRNWSTLSFVWHQLKISHCVAHTLHHSMHSVGISASHLTANQISSRLEPDSSENHTQTPPREPAYDEFSVYCQPWSSSDVTWLIDWSVDHSGNSISSSSRAASEILKLYKLQIAYTGCQLGKSMVLITIVVLPFLLLLFSSSKGNFSLSKWLVLCKG